MKKPIKFFFYGLVIGLALIGAWEFLLRGLGAIGIGYYYRYFGPSNVECIKVEPPPIQPTTVMKEIV